MREVIFTRGVWDDAKRYTDAAKEKELTWIARYDAWIRDQATKHGFPIVALHKDEQDLARVLEALQLS